jgi:glutamyl-tRNA synthetase
MNDKKMKTRFAPSPTGYVHIGNIKTAIVDYLYTKKNKGEFILRFDDTDVERGKKEYEEAIIEDLKWLGLKWDAIYKQSERLALYEEAKQKLIASGRIYPCYETSEELKLMIKSMEARGIPPIYDRRALKLHPDQIAEYEKKGVKPYYRFLLEDKDITWIDEIKGPIKYRGLNFSDPTVFRHNGMPMYTFASVVDDIDMGITNVVRGNDHVTNTAIQIQIFEALGARVPKFAHSSLIKSTEGKISKRIGGFAIRDFRQKGIEAMSIVNCFAHLGTGKDEICLTWDDLIEKFNISDFGNASPNFTSKDLDRINEKYLHGVSFKLIEPKLKELKLGEINEEFWEIIKRNITKLEEIKKWLDVCKQNFQPKIEEKDREFLKIAGKYLPDNINAETWQNWINDIKINSGRNGKELFKPLRKALTGYEDGPELKLFLKFIGREEILRRLGK